jgi:hypothetical protein
MTIMEVLKESWALSLFAANYGTLNFKQRKKVAAHVNRGSNPPIGAAKRSESGCTS